jgi:hypothetical protein
VSGVIRPDKSARMILKTSGASRRENVNTHPVVVARPSAQLCTGAGDPVFQRRQ